MWLGVIVRWSGKLGVVTGVLVTDSCSAIFLSSPDSLLQYQ
ncbi:hypothetical protein SALWKB12_1651 [Snodgrassella communis]|nr:hypothetical protein SALWKB12_1651 [Snodgrassella communis]